MPVNTNIYRKWVAYLEDIGLPPYLVESYSAYIKKLLSSRVPVIFEFNHLAALLGKKKGFLAQAINSPDSFYRIFQIPKRRGGYRTIHAPYPSLLECQRWIYKNILSSFNANDCAHGFVFKKSIRTNAEAHTQNKEILKMDLKKFFPSIPIARVIGVFRKIGYARNVSFYLASLCCYERCLPQGAPTSPALSNIIAFPLDNRLFYMAKKIGLTYTRYADDLTFSGDNLSPKIISYIREIASDEGFEINEEKTRLIKGNGKKVITGISIYQGKMTIPRKYKRQLKKELHFIFKYGYHSHVSKMKIRNPFYLDSLIGRVGFVNWIEPELNYFQDARKKLTSLKAKMSA